MSSTAMDFASKTDAYANAAENGFDASSVSVRVDGATWRYQWHLREFAGVVADAGAGGVTIDVDGAVDVDGGTDATVASGADAAADVVADVVADVIGGALVALLPAGTEMGDADAVDAPVLTDLVILPHTMFLGLSSSPVTPTVEPVDVTMGLTVDVTVEEQPAAVEPVAVVVTDVGVVAPPPVTGADVSVIARDCIIQVHGALPEAVALDMARMLSERHGLIATVRDAASFGVVLTILPGMGKARGGTGGRVGGSVYGGGGVTAAPVVEREESTLDRCKRGVWADGEVPDSNKTILKLKHAIESARGSLGLDVLLAMEFKSQSTYYNQARAYLGHAIAHVERELAAIEAKRAADESALTAEYGF